MLCDWQRMSGKLSFEEKMLIEHICETGLKETRPLRNDKNHDSKAAMLDGAILVFESVQDTKFETVDEFLNQYHVLNDRREMFREQSNAWDYWTIRGQQLQIEFILDRLLAFRVLNGELESPVSARAAQFILQWKNK